jgi:hypothetical protein
MDCWDKDLTSSADNAALHMGDGWCTFADLDNFDNEKLLNSLTLKVCFQPLIIIFFNQILLK